MYSGYDITNSSDVGLTRFKPALNKISAPKFLSLSEESTFVPPQVFFEVGVGGWTSVVEFEFVEETRVFYVRGSKIEITKLYRIILFFGVHGS